MAFDFHLPLSPIDSINQPSLEYLQIQDGVLLATCTLWTTAYILYIRQARIDQSYGMPVLFLCDPTSRTPQWLNPSNQPRCANIARELTFSLFPPHSTGETITGIAWLAVDLGLIRSTLRFSQREWKYAPWIANNMGLIIASGSAVFLLLFWAWIEMSGSSYDVGFWSGFLLQNLLGFLSIGQILSRGSTRGHSLGIW